MQKRERTLTVKLSDEELARVHVLARAGDESIGRWLRRAIQAEYRARFGEAPPPPLVLRRARNENDNATK